LIIEWIGCSGTGKSTLSEEVYKNLHSSGINAQKPLEVFLGKTFSQFITNETLQNLFLDLIVLPWSICSIAKHRHFLKYCLNILKRDYSSLKVRIKLIRSILRKMGLHVFFNNFCSTKQTILVDEGTVHIAHLLFANGDKVNVSPNDIKKFCELVPTPDLIIHIMAPESEVIARTLKRKDKPIAETSPDALKQFIALGQEIFKIMSHLNPWDKKTITFSNPDKASKNMQEEALNITNQIMNIFSSLKNENHSLN
jgi:thymidylate kinase